MASPDWGALAPPVSEHGIEDVRRAREFYHYFQPNDLVQPQLRETSVLDMSAGGEVPELSKTLSPYCQLTALRMNVRKAMVNFMDRSIMYFLSEATKYEVGDTHMHEFVDDPILMSCTSAPLKGRICEMTIRLDAQGGTTQVPFYVVNDLSESQFKHMAIIDGPPYYRFYAGVPITTSDGINIGSLAVMDIRPRPNGLTNTEQLFLANTAQQIMMFLQTNRQAIEGRRTRCAADGLAAFISGRKSMHDQRSRPLHSLLRKQQRAKLNYGVDMSGEGELFASPKKSHTSTFLNEQADEVSLSGQSSDAEDVESDTEVDSRTHTKTFARAANLLRECLGNLGEEGAVAFVTVEASVSGPTLRKGYNPNGPVNGLNGTTTITTDRCLCVAFSTRAESEMSSGEPLKGIEGDVLRELVTRYPGGRLFNLDSASASSSSEDETQASRPPRKSSDSSKRPSRRKQLELNMLGALFPSARQVLFTPLWDATTGSFAYACFVAGTMESRPFTSTIELPFLNSFCSTVMGECSRLDTILADKQKSDFVGTISHEMRSPLHGLLASVEFLAETDLSSFQSELISTIDSCGRTLLDTINHVLDFSKINSFQKHWQASNNKRHSQNSRRYTYLGPENSSKAISHGAPALLQLLGVVDVAAVLEEVVDGLVLGHTYLNSGVDLTDMSREARGRAKSTSYKSTNADTDAVNIIVDVQKADWSFVTQPGAVRRIIMNITGNAMKYTSRGSIHIRLQLQQGQDDQGSQSLVLTVTDTGRGISQDFINSRLFVPFAQENSLAPGTGLGLSIVKSIVLMLGGGIEVRSKIRQGTTVEVTLPVKRPLPGQMSTQTTPYSDATAGATSTTGSGADSSLQLLRDQWSNSTVTFWRSDSQPDDNLTRIVRNYVLEWCDLPFVEQPLCDSCDLIIVEEQNLDALLNRLVATPGRRPALAVLCSVLSKHSAVLIQDLEQRICSAVEFVSQPFGPYKLARSIRLAFEKHATMRRRFSRQFNSKVILPTPLEEVPSMKPQSDEMTSNLAEMNLNPPGQTEDAQFVQATETFAASQASQNAQMALHDPTTTLRTPRGDHPSEGDSFPFPSHVQEDSRMRRESDRGVHLGVRHDSSDSPTPLANPRPRSFQELAPIPSTNEVNPRVLLVDDNKINLRLLHTYLKTKRRYTHITQAEDGQQAVDAVKTATPPFDVIFMDISMPILDGFEATRAIRDFEEVNNTKPGAMVIALTGLASARDQSEVFNSGCDIYMTKPVSFKEVGKLLNNWEKHKDLNASNGVE